MKKIVFALLIPFFAHAQTPERELNFKIFESENNYIACRYNPEENELVVVTKKSGGIPSIFASSEIGSPVILEKLYDSYNAKYSQFLYKYRALEYSKSFIINSQNMGQCQ